LIEMVKRDERVVDLLTDYRPAWVGERRPFKLDRNQLFACSALTRMTREASMFFSLTNKRSFYILAIYNEYIE
jgi:hypothetical protein